MIELFSQGVVMSRISGFAGAAFVRLQEILEEGGEECEGMLHALILEPISQLARAGFVGANLEFAAARAYHGAGQ